jgi:putative ABC transport system permease protein
LIVAGVIGDVRHSALKTLPKPESFVPHLQGTVKDNETPSPKMFLMIRTDGDPLRFAGEVRAAVESLDPDQPVADIATMRQRLDENLAPERFQLFLFGGFSSLALLLASVGIYGVMSYSVRLACTRSAFASLWGRAPLTS